MPTIKANEKQLSALKDIETALKIVSDINAIFSTHSDVCVSCKEGKGRATKEYSVVLDDGTKKKVLTALNAVKDRLRKRQDTTSLFPMTSLRFSPPAERIPTRSQRAKQTPQKVWTNPASLMRKRQPMQGRRMPRRMAVPIPAASPLWAITDTQYTKTAPQASVCGAYLLVI